MLAHAFWREVFGADPTIVGRQITLGGVPHDVIGVLPPGSPWLDGADVFVPLLRRTDANKSSWEFTVIGRIKPGVTFDAAVADLDRVARLLAATVPENKGQGVLARPSSAWIASDSLRSMLWMLLAASGLLLVIGAVNVTNLLLARASARARETAVRAALGATRFDLVRERIIESLVLSLAAVAVGTALAYGVIEVLRSFDPGGIPRLAEVHLNGWALLFGSSAAVLVGIATGLAPGLAPLSAVSTTLRSGGRGSTGDRRHDRLRAVFVAAQVALSLLLLIGAGLLVRSLYQVLSAERGFSAEQRLVATVSLPASYGAGRLQQMTTEILHTLEQHPDLMSAAVVSIVPLAPGSTGLGAAPGDRVMADEEAPWASWRLVSKDYFKTIGLPLIAGRTFTEQDILSKPWRAIISRRLAEEFWPGQSAIGRPIVLWTGQGNTRGEVIGVVGNMRERGLEADPTRAVYFPVYGALATTTLQLVVHTRADPLAFTPVLRDLVRGVDSTLPLSNVRAMDEMVAASVATRRFTMLLLVTFAALALVLATAGVYGVIAYSITRRTQEIGVRLALGAAQGRVLRQAIGRGLRPVLVGALLGVVGAFWLSNVMTTLVYQITPRDPLTYAVVCGALLVTACAACYLPARQVLKVDPVIALRVE
jgi:predicted permease